MPLRVRTDVPYGNACGIAVRETDAGPEVSFAADPHGGPETLWFCLRIERDRPPRPRPGAPADAPGDDRPLRLVLEHTDNLLGGHRPEDLQPVVRRDGADWDRLPPGRPETLSDGRKRVAWTVDAPAPGLDVAFCYPYGMPEVEALVAETGGAWRADTIGFSQGARPLVRLSNDPGAPGADRPGLYVLARQHSGETPGSWVLDGFLRRLAEAGDAAPIVWAVPLANIDGVEGGDYGKDNFPYDLNRAWGPAPMRHETLVLQRDARRFADRCRPVAGLDFHAPGGCQTEGVYAYVPDPETEADAAAATRPWAGAFAEALGPGLAASEFGVVARYASRWETPGFRRFAWSELGVPALTIETPYARCGRTVLTRDVYRDVGRRLADATLARCRA